MNRGQIESLKRTATDIIKATNTWKHVISETEVSMSVVVNKDEALRLAKELMETTERFYKATATMVTKNEYIKSVKETRLT